MSTLGEPLPVEHAEPDIRVNTVEPGYVRTRQTEGIRENPEGPGASHGRTPIGRYADRNAVVAAVRCLAAPDASFVTGETIRIHGGFSLYYRTR